MKCPKCGYRRQTRDDAYVTATECPACGIVYSKHDHNTPATVTTGATRPPYLKPSPIDPESLKKARDRVEKRLRRQLEIKVKDQRHEKTLKLARRFAEREVRKRRENWERINAPATANKDMLDQKGKAAPAARTITEDLDETRADTAIAPPAQSVVPPQPHTAADVMKKNAFAQAVPRATPAAETLEEVEAQPDVCVKTIVLDASDSVFNNQSETTAEAHSNGGEQPQDPCGEFTQEAVPQDEPLDLMTLVSRRVAGNRSGGGLVRLFPSIAWLILCSGLIGAVLSWITISDVEAGGNIPIPDSVGALPLGLLLGFAYLATGALGFAFFWVSSLIGNQLKDIRRLLLIRPGMAPNDAVDPLLPSDDTQPGH